MPDNLSTKTQLDIMSRAMDISGVEKPAKTSMIPNFKISEDSLLKYHFRYREYFCNKIKHF